MIASVRRSGQTIYDSVLFEIQGEGKGWFESPADDKDVNQVNVGDKLEITSSDGRINVFVRLASKFGELGRLGYVVNVVGKSLQ